MTAGAASAAAAADAAASQRLAAALGIAFRKLAGGLQTLAALTGNGRIRFFHRAQDVKMFSAFFTHIFINRHCNTSMETSSRFYSGWRAGSTHTCQN